MNCQSLQNTLTNFTDPFTEGFAGIDVVQASAFLPLLGSISTSASTRRSLVQLLPWLVVRESDVLVL